MTGNAKRQREIFELFRDVETSSLSVKDYFATHQTPVSRAQYYLLKKRYEQLGFEGLEDQRHAGNARKITPEQEELVRGILTYNRHLSSKSLQEELLKTWGITFSQRRIDQLRQKHSLSHIPPPRVEKEIVQFAGIEIFSAVAHHIGILEPWFETITQRLNQIPRDDSSTTRGKASKGDHIYARRHGKFSARYNRLSRIRTQKFASITEKVKHKDLRRLSLYHAKEESINRKNLAVLLLPLVTNNGASRSLDKPLGNALHTACGYNYKHATIDKYLRELKYLQISSDLINCNARFWSTFWKQYDASDQKMACYYIDGNVKPLWSSKRCRKGKVTMLGRVMGCLEQVILHDGYGHPLYFQTFSGHADLQHYALQSFEQLSELVNEGQPTGPKKCHRALVMDGGGNAVGTLRAFSKSAYHYITILDTNQMNARKFKHQSPSERYRYGDATLIDCRIEMRDSKEPTYLYESRAVRTCWDSGKECCLVTSIPNSIFDASEVVKAYFDRWPYCEKQYSMMKAATCFYQVVGYGKKHHDDTTMIARIKTLEDRLHALHQELQDPLSQVHAKEQELIQFCAKERTLKEHSTIQDGKRIQSQKNQDALEDCQRTIRKIQRDIKKIEAPFKDRFKKLRQVRKEFARIQGKDKIYHVDVELDQLLTSFRLTLANTLAFLARVILDNMHVEMNTLIQSILFLSGSIEHTPDIRKICLHENTKDPQFMAVLSKGLKTLNLLKIRHPSGRIYEFELT